MKVSSIDLIRMIGSPFHPPVAERPDDESLLASIAPAFEDRVALLLLHTYRRDGWDPRLEQAWQEYRDRELMTRVVARDVAATLEKVAPGEYVVFKSLKPYPATPNDTDVLFLGDRRGYEAAYAHLLASGYHFHEWAPTQRTIYDARGVGKIGKGKKGGTFYIDFYEDVATDYFSYMNKHRLRPFIITRDVEGGSVPLLRPEPELGIVLFHSVFPERTYQLEHFFLPLYHLASPGFDTAAFVRFVRDNDMKSAVRASLSISQELHERALGTRVPVVQDILRDLGEGKRDVAAFRQRGSRTPYMFTVATFAVSFGEKLWDPYSLRSLFKQFRKMLDPRFALEVFQALRRRLSAKGTYHQE